MVGISSCKENPTAPSWPRSEVPAVTIYSTGDSQEANGDFKITWTWAIGNKPLELTNVTYDLRDSTGSSIAFIETFSDIVYGQQHGPFETIANNVAGTAAPFVTYSYEYILTFTYADGITTETVDVPYTAFYVH